MRDTFIEKLSKFNWESIKRKFHYWQKLELSKIVHNAKLHW